MFKFFKNMFKSFQYSFILHVSLIQQRPQLSSGGISSDSEASTNLVPLNDAADTKLKRRKAIKHESKSDFD